MTEERQPAEPRHEAGTARIYANDRVEVTWEPAYCIHVAACVRGSIAAFDPQRRPWIDPDAETPERIVEIVERCPTGALHARLLGAEAPAPAVEPASMEAASLQPRRNGPLFVQGPVRIVDQQGNVVREDTRLALCRCGGSANKPFCDGTHRRIGFTT